MADTNIQNGNDRANDGDMFDPNLLVNATKHIDFALLFGLTSAFSLIFGALLLGGSVASFYNIPAVLIVVFGTISITMVSFNFNEIKQALYDAFRVFYTPLYSESVAVKNIIGLAKFSKDRGILALDELNNILKNEPFLQRSIALVVDGNNAIILEQALRNEVMSIAKTKQKSVAILRKVSETAPAMGLIGTLVGLIQLLGNLDSPSQIGPAMAVALLTTFYGAVLAYMVFSPIAAKLDNNINKQMVVFDIYIAGALSISKQENTHLLKIYLESESNLKE
jgi:chemotaxis protein MotA